MEQYKDDDRYQSALRINGFAFHNYEELYYRDLLSKNPNVALDDSKKHEAEHECTSIDGFRVRPKVVTSVQEYLNIIDKLKTSSANPVLYHGQTNANTYPLPYVLRTNPDKENRLYDEFRRRFPEELQNCTNNMERLVFMQHYGLATRCYDLSENPFVALYFACADMVKFREKKDADQYKWGSVFLFRMPEDSLSDIKPSDSSTVSVIATTATLDKEFSLKKLQIDFRNDGHLSSNDSFIYFRDIIRRSVIVRTKQDNPRIRNQRGLFIMFNANRISNIFDRCSNELNVVSPDDFMDYVLTKADPELNLFSLQKGMCSDYPTEFKNTTEWDFRFEKIIPYSLENKNPLMQNDPFDIKRLYYRDSDKAQLVVLIPPTAKKRIKQQLANIGFTEEFIYPELDSVSYALNNAEY